MDLAGASWLVSNERSFHLYRHRHPHVAGDGHLAPLVHDHRVGHVHAEKRTEVVGELLGSELSQARAISYLQNLCLKGFAHWYST